MDFDGDGELDLVSGSYDPGELYLFRGEGNGQFAAREVIRDKSGKPILKIPNQKDRVESFGSWMTMVDWDADGDLDILVGTFDGFIFLRRNDGNRTSPTYVTTNEWLKVRAKPLRVPGGEHANPVVADWDGDDRWDIITGSGGGGVYWYRNVGSPRQPEFLTPVSLVPEHDGDGYSEMLDVDEEPIPGIRSQIAVVDYDEDGKLDLLVGDFCTYLHVKKGLTQEQRAELKTVQTRHDEAVKRLRDGMAALRERWKDVMKGVPQSEWNTPENSAKWQEMYQEMRNSPAYKKQRELYEAAEKELRAYVASGGARGGGPDVAHGFVWFFRRR